MKNCYQPLIPGTLSALIGLYAHTSQAQDWPQYLGPDRNGHVAEFSPPSSWPDALEPVWQVEIGDGVASPALVGDRLYTFSREDPYEVLRCLNADTGEEIWQVKHESLAPTGGAARYAGPRSTPTVANGKIITYGVRGALMCVEAESGDVIWRKEGGSGGWPNFFTSSSPIVVDGLCIAQLGNDNTGSITAFDMASGEQKWQWAGDGTAYASPVLMEFEGSKLVVAQSAKHVVALTAADGRLAWEMAYGGGGRDNNTITPIVQGARVIVSGSGRGVTALQLQKSGDTISATELWKNTDNSPQFSVPILTQGLVLGLSQGNELYCIDVATGETGWTADIAGAEQGGGRRGGGRGFGSLVATENLAFFLSTNSELIVFEPDAKNYIEVARIKVSDSTTPAYPVISGKRLFLKDQNSVSLLKFE